MGVDRALVTVELITAYLVDQLVAGEHPARGPRQRGEDPPFGGGELDGLAPHHHPAALLVDDQLASPVAGWHRTVGNNPAPAQDRLDPQDQLPGAKRFGDVVVSPELETGDALVLLALGREHHDGDVRRSPQLP